MPAMIADAEPAKTSGYFEHVRAEIGPLLPARAERVLEIGCGAAGTMRWLRSTAEVDSATGIDIEEAAARRARAVFDHVVVANLNQGYPEMPGGPFDLVLALDVLEHLVDPWDVLRWIRGMMQPDGTIIISIPNTAHYSVAFPLFFKGAWDYADEGHLDRTHLRLFTRATGEHLLTSSGFAIRKVERNVVVPRLCEAVGLNSRRWRWWNQKALSRLLPERWTTSQHLIAASPSAQ